MTRSINQKLDKKPIDYWPKRRIKTRVTNLFNKYGHFYVCSPGFNILQTGLREMDLTIHGAGKYRSGKKKRR